MTFTEKAARELRQNRFTYDITQAATRVEALLEQKNPRHSQEIARLRAEHGKIADFVEETGMACACAPSAAFGLAP